MLVRKRPRPQMKRTASMSGIKVDVSHVEGGQPSDHHHSPGSWQNPPAIAADADLMNYTLSFVSPRGRRNLSAFNDGGDDSVHFLRTCTFCHRRLSPARDIYMYMYEIQTLSPNFFFVFSYLNIKLYLIFIKIKWPV